MKEDYSKESYKDWVIIHGLSFKRKLKNEMAFDGIVKVYSIKTDSEKINKTLSGFYFGSLGTQTTNGILLRQFKSKDSWPRTILTHLNFETGELKIIKDSKSSYETWTVKELGTGKYKVQLSPTEAVEFIDKLTVELNCCVFKRWRSFLAMEAN